MFTEFCVYLAAALFCTFKMTQIILKNVGFKKCACIIWWILTIDAVIFLEYACFGVEASNFGSIFILIGFVYLMILSISYVLRSESLCNRILVFVGWLGFLFVLSFSLAEIIVFMYLFKVLTMLALLMGIIIIKDASPIVKIVMSIIFYLGMVVFDVMLTTGFLFSSVDKAVEAIYIGFQRIYCLNPLSPDYQKGELLTNIVDYLICRIMDVILLGFLSSTFIEICNRNLKQKPEAKIMKD